jgi:hypothetical protein
VLYGAEFNAAIEQLSPTPAKPPRVLHPRNWQRVTDEVEKPPAPDQSDSTLS